MPLGVGELVVEEIANNGEQALFMGLDVGNTAQYHPVTLDKAALRTGIDGGLARV